MEGNVDMREGKEGRYEIKGKGEDMVLEGEMGRIEKEGEKRELV